MSERHTEQTHESSASRRWQVFGLKLGIVIFLAFFLITFDRARDPVHVAISFAMIVLYAFLLPMYLAFDALLLSGETSQAEGRRSSYIIFAIVTLLMVGTPLVTAIPKYIESFTPPVMPGSGNANRQKSHQHPTMGFISGRDNYDPPVTIGSHEHVVDYDRPRILFIGDSILYGWEVEEHQSAAARVREKLPQYNVINAALPGYGPVHEYMYYEILAPLVEPDITVVGYFVGNDFEQMVYEYASNLRQPFYVPDGEGGIRRYREDLRFPLLHPWEFYRFTPIMQPFWRYDSHAMITLAQRYLSDIVLTEDEAKFVLSKIIDRKAKLAAKVESELIFVILPTLSLFGEDDYVALHHDSWAALKEVLAKSGQEYFDFAAWVNDREIKDKRGIFNPDLAHLAPYGNELLSQALVEAFQQRSWVPVQRSLRAEP